MAKLENSADAKSLLGTDPEAPASLRKSGVNVHEQTDAEREAWQKASASVWTSVEGQFGKDFVGKLRSYAQ
ncbi:MAG: hypothetical protein J0H17_06930 [Rhizobiales bacterium]|nr:hypothetical protein [Hyphomicrobiales bacterium]